MSNPVGKNDSALESAEPSEAGDINAKVEHESFPPLNTDSVGVEIAQLDKEANLVSIYSIAESSVTDDATQEIPMDIDMPSESKVNDDPQFSSVNPLETICMPKTVADAKNDKENELGNENKENVNRVFESDITADENNHHTEALLSVNQEGFGGDKPTQDDGFNQSFSFDLSYGDGDDSGTEEEQGAFMKELESFFKERSLEFKPPKFYGEGLNCLKLWRAVTRLGGYDQVTSCKLWRQVGESFKPPKTCTTVSWSFRCFYEKALFEYEKHKVRTGELQVSISSFPEPVSVDNQAGGNKASGPGRARRDAAARAMQGWHSQRMLGNDEVGDPVIKDKVPISLIKRDKHLKPIGAFKRKKSSNMEREAKVAQSKLVKLQADLMVVDIGSPADWVKINVRTTKDCFEVYALVPGLLREEIHVQSDPAGRLIISGEPEQPDNPWGVTPFKKVITLPSRIDPHQTSAVVTLHGQLFVRAPFEQERLCGKLQQELQSCGFGYVNKNEK